MPISRRNLIQLLPATAAALSLPGRSAAQTVHHVVVIGGGFAGCTAAKYLKLWGGDRVAVTLVESRARHVSCVMSNLVLNEQLKVSDLAFYYDKLASNYGVTVVRDRARRINGPDKLIKLRDAGWVPYDSLVVATGIKFESIPGLDTRLVPHAWIAGGQTNRLRNQIRTMPDNGTFVMTIPKAPYRCPPGPYERACLVADILGRRSGALGGSASPANTPKVVVLDANPQIMAERETFSRAFDGLYGNIIEYRSDVEVDSVDSEARTVFTTSGQSFAGDVLNVIPRHRAGQLVYRSGLTGGDDSRWAPVDPVTYESTLPDFPGVHIIGDSQGTGQPKSGHMANAQAKVCADAILRRSMGLPTHGAERLANITTNSACFSPITHSRASWLTAVYRYNPGTGLMELAPGSLGEAHEWNSENYEDMFSWSRNLFADTFA
ncbi:MAG: NAD(P)/FAD-dependent oxidoreductase [Halioglobus sp.]